MERQERGHVLHFLVHLNPINLSLASLGKCKHGTLWEAEGTVMDVEEEIHTETVKVKAESGKNLLSWVYN